MKRRPGELFGVLAATGLSCSLLLACTYDYDGLRGGHGGTISAMNPTGGSKWVGGAVGTQIATGGSNQGGAILDRTGGEQAGGPSMGGVSTGGVSTGGAATGGAATGGAVPTGGASTSGGGGSATGGGPTGGRGGAEEKGSDTGGVATGGAVAIADLVLRYAFEETSGTVLKDTSGAAGGPRNGMAATAGSGGHATFTTNKMVGGGALELAGQSNSAGGYVTAPSLAAIAPQAITLAVWINLASGAANNQRVFDFGTGTDKYFFLTANDSMNRLRCAITSGGRLGEQVLIASPVPTQSWHHVAVTLAAGSPYTGTLYVDGTAVATNNAMTLHATDLGTTTGNYLGRSAFSSDPYFNGVLDDFRIYRRALGAAEIAALVKVRE